MERYLSKGLSPLSYVSPNFHPSPVEGPGFTTSQTGVQFTPRRNLHVHLIKVGLYQGSHQSLQVVSELGELGKIHKCRFTSVV